MKNNPKNTRTSDWPPLLTFVFAGIVIAFTCIAILSTFFRSELVMDRYYSEGLNYDTRRSQVQHTSEISDELEVVYSAPADLLMIQFPLSMDPGAIHGFIHLYRPAAQEMDSTIQIQPNVDLNQVISTSAMDNGLWRIKIEWTNAERDYYYEQQVTIE